MTQTPSSSSSSSTTSTSSTSSSTTPLNTCQVTNSIVLPISPSTGAQTNWNGDIIVISGYDSSGNATDFQQSDLTLLSFTEEGSSVSALSATTSSNSGALPINSVGILNLLPYYVPGSTTEVMSAYSLLVCQANNCFPVYTYGEIQKRGSFPAITVPGPSPCNSSSAANAYVFLQNMMAFPSSPLAQQFTTALNTATAANSSESVSSAIDSFFSGTTDYTNVNFDVFTAVMSYGQTFPYIWANFQSSYTYNFYSTTPTSSDSSADGDNVTVNEQVTCLGTVVFTLTNSSPSTPAEAMTAYSITWTPAGKNQTAVPLTLSDGQLVSNNSAGFGGICLQCTFMDKAALTGSSADSGIPIQALTGLIDNTNVIGSPVTLTESVAEQISAGLSSIMTSKAFETLQISICLYMGLELMTKLCVWIKGKIVKTGQPPTDQEIDAKETDLQNNADEKLDDIGNENGVQSGNELIESQANANSELSEEAQVQVQYQEENAQLEVQDNPTVENEVDATNEVQDQLEEVNPQTDGASTELSNIQGELTQDQTNITTENTNLNMSTSETVKPVTQDTKLANQEESDQETDQKAEADDDAGDGSEILDAAADG